MRKTAKETRKFGLTYTWSTCQANDNYQSITISFTIHQLTLISSQGARICFKVPQANNGTSELSRGFETTLNMKQISKCQSYFWKHSDLDLQRDLNNILCYCLIISIPYIIFIDFPGINSNNQNSSLLVNCLID